ncbi:AAA family ATPase [Methylobacterium sp. J-070]|uniref:AAA family ATPase n=1 Tax=Methylobacterium sp. J-070 TaxID=2836650 RepID=UPI001FBA17B0|nr:AAA family ATPase [Methylobacterium sp. J-070]MCJ2048527.1 helicase RepA family protein [Methylobacterium sp. J-070]
MNSPQTSADRFRLVPFDAIKLGTAPRYRVKGLLPLVGLALFWGPPKCGKSFLVMDLLMHVALGWTYRGRRVVPGSIVYCALEGQQGFEARVEAFRQLHLAEAAEPTPFYLMPSPLNLVQDHAALIAGIRMQMPVGQRPGVVCLDTLNRSFIGSESDDEAMTAYVKAADAIRDAFGCLVVIIHHCGVEGTRPRGHSALAGAIDAQLAVRKTGEGLVTVTVDLMKDGPEGDTFASRLEPVEVGEDDEGDAITSCIVEAVVEAPVASRPGKQAGKRLSERNRLALEALREAVMAKGVAAPTTLALPAEIRVVPPDAWREELFRRGILDRDASGYREQFRRMKLDLMAREAVAERDGSLWIVP